MPQLSFGRLSSGPPNLFLSVLGLLQGIATGGAGRQASETDLSDRSAAIE
jgi:hypothetical protein